MKKQSKIIIKAKFYTFLLLSCFIVKATNQTCEELKNEYNNALNILNNSSEGISPEKSLKLCKVVEAIQKYKTSCQTEANESGISETNYFQDWEDQTTSLRDECNCLYNAWHCFETRQGKGLECGIGNERRKIDPPIPINDDKCDDDSGDDSGDDAADW